MSTVVVHLGPSMPLGDARRLLPDAEFRPPIRRGDMEGAEAGMVVAIIDGVFEQDLAVSPREIQEALDRGVVVFGGSSMGALRAAEVPAVFGVGRVFEWYRDQIITRDDEVALLFDPSSGRALTVPAVNVRFAVERLCSLGTIDWELGKALISAALELPFKERTYPAILAAAGVANRSDSDDLAAMLDSQDLKRRDAHAVLEAVDRYLHERDEPTRACSTTAPSPSPGTIPEARKGNGALIWESGDHVSDEELHDFLAFTGKLETYARAVLARISLEAGASLGDLHRHVDADPQAELRSAAERWGWKSPEEARVTLADLGLDEQGLGQECYREALCRELARLLARERTRPFSESLRAALFLDDLALKRETMRSGSLRYFAELVDGPPTPEELATARTVLCKVNLSFGFSNLRRRWEHLGLDDPAAHDAFVAQLARARRSARVLADRMRGGSSSTTRPPEGIAIEGFELGPRPKPAGESRFCHTLEQAEHHARRIARTIGVTRVGMIGELGDLDGVHVAQASRPGSSWSSSYGSGKSRVKEGAIVGSIMEEAEKWAQEQYRFEHPLITGSFRDLAPRGGFIDPARLDLPYDSTYDPAACLDWYPCVDLLAGRIVHLPLDALVMNRRKHDIYYTRRGARKHMATNGLGSGFSREEAVLHGLCEYIERHAQRLAELLLANPGGLGAPPHRFVDLTTVSAVVAELAERLGRNSATVRVLDITSEIRIPTFVASITRDLQRADGYGAHPDPATAIEMALLEAAQTIASATAGGREDLSIRARSLGRHERPRPISHEDAWFWLDPDTVYQTIHQIDGLSSDDVHTDLAWCLDRVRAAGLDSVLVADITPPGIEPAHVVRVIVPGLETNNPFYTGPRARLVLLRDLLPRWR